MRIDIPWHFFASFHSGSRCLGNCQNALGTDTGCSAKLALDLFRAAMVQALGEAFSPQRAEGRAADRFLAAVAKSGLAARFRLADLRNDVNLPVGHAEARGLDFPVAQMLRDRPARIDGNYDDADGAASTAAQLDLMRQPEGARGTMGRSHT